MQSKILFQSQVAWMFDAKPSMHHGKKFQWTWTNSSGRKYSFFQKKSIKIYKGSCQKIFLRYVVVSSSVWWSQTSQASYLTLHPHYVACFSLPPTFLSSTRHSVTILTKYFWHILNIFIHFSRVNVLAKIGPNIFWRLLSKSSA